MANKIDKTIVNLSYRDKLDSCAKNRYDSKLKIIGGLDPYQDKLKWSHDVDILPAVTYPDIVNYLMFTPSQFKKDDLKAWKGLEAVNQLCNGWIREVGSLVCGKFVLVTAKVLHSQRIRAKLLRPWIVAQPDGVVAAAHCDCMAGLGEACTHIASLLFQISTTIQVRDTATCTEKKAYWLLPTSLKAVSYKEVSEINFTSAKTAKKRLDEQIESACSESDVKRPITPVVTVRKNNVPKANHDDFLAFCAKLKKLDTKPAILAVVEPFAEDYKPAADSKDFPVVLSEFRDETLIGKELDTVIAKCSAIKVACSKEQAENVEYETRMQSKTPLWHRFRAGRVTASNAKSVCSTNLTSPAQSLVKTVCYPGSNNFQTAATKWGTDNEKKARDEFMKVLCDEHQNLCVEDSGLVISQDIPYIGASPDGLLTCDCCGTACLEIKCPFKLKSEPINSANLKYLCEVDGQLSLKKTDKYYYQIQTQLGVTKNDMAYFVVWTPTELLIEEINFDQTVWDEICKKSQFFFYRSVLPELVGKVYTSLPIMSSPSSTDINKDSESQIKLNTLPKTVKVNSVTAKPVLKSIENIKAKQVATNDEIVYCVCGQVEFGKMVACDNVECAIEWFHYGCVNIENAPTGKWYCMECRKLPAFKRRRFIRD